MWTNLLELTDVPMFAVAVAATALWIEAILADDHATIGDHEFDIAGAGGIVEANAANRCKRIHGEKILGVAKRMWVERGLMEECGEWRRMY